MTIKAGEKMPSGTLKRMTKEGPKDLSTEELFKGKKVVLFSRARAPSRPPATPSTCRALWNSPTRSVPRAWTRSPAWR